MGHHRNKAVGRLDSREYPAFRRMTSRWRTMNSNSKCRDTAPRRPATPGVFTFRSCAQELQWGRLTQCTAQQRQIASAALSWLRWAAWNGRCPSVEKMFINVRVHERTARRFTNTAITRPYRAWNAPPSRSGTPHDLLISTLDTLKAACPRPLASPHGLQRKHLA